MAAKTAKTTAKRATKSTAKSTKKAASAATETETNQFETMAAKAQEQYFSILEQGQTLVLDGFEAIVDTMAKYEIPAIPGISSTPRELPTITIPNEMVESYFEFANKALANQREFANKALALASKSN